MRQRDNKGGPSGVAGVVMTVLLRAGGPAAAQSLGSFTWQLRPYCNRLTITGP